MVSSEDLEWKNLDKCSSFEKLKKAARVNLRKVMNSENSVKRIREFQTAAGGALTYNYAAKAADKTVLSFLQELADEQELIEKYKSLACGAIINTGENRMVLHHLTRGALCGEVFYKDINLHDFYLSQAERIKIFSEKIHSGKLLSVNGCKFTDAVQIGIGGSDLGPRAMYFALEQWAKKHGKLKLKAHFISNIDSEELSSVLSSLDLKKTLFIIVSKSGSTQETFTNGEIVKKILLSHGIEPCKSIAAVTSEGSPLADDSQYMEVFHIDDFIGGRCSSTSACGGLLLSLAFGFEVFERILQGAHEADKLAMKKNITENAAALDALLGVYERNILGCTSFAVLPYSSALFCFTLHLQQLDMESNGKSVNRFGEKLNYAAGAVTFGGTGTNAQHSFYQLLHQGSEIIPLQFIGFKESSYSECGIIKDSGSREKLSANLAAQISAFASGCANPNLNKNFEGNRPSSLIYGEKLTPEAAGALLAHYENKIMFQGFIWNVNSFDQEGVQLGKTLTKCILEGKAEGALKEYAELLGI